MPELPEVEVVRKQLKNLVLNKKIANITSEYTKIFNEDFNLVKESIVGSKIIDIERYGKYLVFILSNEFNLISHLRMEGKYFVKEQNEPIDKHEHVIFHFDNGETLRYHDTRKFGRMDLRTKDNYLKVNPLFKLGKEPKDLTGEELYEMLNKKTTFIKVALLDQEIIAGLGNIYVDETLFMSKIHPERRSNTISIDEANLIVHSAQKVLAKALELGGTTIRSYTSSLGVTGRFQNELQVHTKEGELCTLCGTVITKLKVGGRGTYVCSNCQK